MSAADVETCERALTFAMSTANRGIVAVNLLLSLIAAFLMWRWLRGESMRKAARLVGWDLKASRERCDDRANADFAVDRGRRPRLLCDHTFRRDLDKRL